MAPYVSHSGISVMCKVEPLMWTQTAPKPRPPAKPYIDAGENTTFHSVSHGGEEYYKVYINRVCEAEGGYLGWEVGNPKTHMKHC